MLKHVFVWSCEKALFATTCKAAKRFINLHELHGWKWRTSKMAETQREIKLFLIKGEKLLHIFCCCFSCLSSQLRPRKSLGIDLKLIKLLKIYHGREPEGKISESGALEDGDINYKRCLPKQQQLRAMESRGSENWWEVDKGNISFYAIKITPPISPQRSRHQT